MSVKIDVGRRRAVGLMIAVAGLSLLAASGASAASFAVKNTGEFAAAVTKANGNGEANTIVLASGTYLPSKALTFTNTSGLQTIEGPAGAPTVKGEPAELSGGSIEPVGELLVVKKGVSVAFKNVEIEGGGGEGLPSLEDSGTVAIESSTVVNVGTSVAVEPEATLIVRNSTISDGRNFGVVDDGTASFFNSTVAFNQIGGIENAGVLNLTNTIVAENKGGGDCVGAATTSDHSLDSDGSCGVGTLSKTNPLLQPAPQNNGGTTPLHSLKPGSPAIGAGDSATCTTTDQRGAHRSSPCSIGADEYSSTPPTIKVPANITTGATGPGGAPVEYEATATGSEDLVRSFNCTPASGSTFAVGTTTVECTAVDGHENTAKASFKVTVTPPACAASPTVETNPSNDTVTAPASAAFTVKEGTVPANCSAATIQWELSTNSGATFAPIGGATSATYTINPTSASESGDEFRAVLKNTHGSSTSTAATLTVNAAATSPEAAIRKLLHEVSSSTIPHGIRHELSCLLNDTLRSLAGLGGYGPSNCETAFLSSREATTKSDRQKTGACEDLQQFIDVIKNDQHTRKPKIPAKLAAAWSKTASDIEASLGCTSPGKSPGHPSRHAHGHRRGHRSNGR